MSYIPTLSFNPDGTTIENVNGVTGVVGLSVTALTDIGALALSDVDTVNRGGTDFKTTQSSRISLIQKTPAASRSAALPATLTASDNNKTVLLMGATGALSVDGTVADGFYCRIINQASGAATYSGITGLQSTTALASGGSANIMMVGALVFATASVGVTITPATAYSTALSSNSGLTGVPVTLSFVPNGTWQSGQAITPTLNTITGTFSTVTNGTLSGGVVTPVAGNNATVTVQFTPSSASGVSGTLSSTATNVTNTTGGSAYSIASIRYPTITTANVRCIIIADASALTGANGSAVTSIPDQSGNSYALTGGSATLVTGAQNGMNGIAFAGSSITQAMQVVTSAAGGLGGDFSGLLVVKAESFVGGPILLWIGNSSTTGDSTGPGTDQFALYTFSSNILGLNRIANGSERGSAAIPATSGPLHKIVWRYTAATATIQLFVNGSQVTAQNLNLSNVLATANTATSATWNMISLGASNAGNTTFYTPYAGQFLELQLYGGALAATDLTTLQNYATSKWGS